MAEQFEISSTLPVDAATLWTHCSSMKGVSRELWPLIRMTYPKSAESLVPEPFVRGQALFRSYLFLFGVLPVDRSDLTLIEVEPGRRFLESSPMATQRAWTHERLLEPVPEGTRITDRLEWEGKLPAATMLYGISVPILFKWRHRRLKKLFTGRHPPSASKARRR